jgi:hypothetical protein
MYQLCTATRVNLFIRRLIPMLHIYTRHAADCGHADDTQWRRCRCPKWLRGVLPNGGIVRGSAGTRSWEQAERYARKKEAEYIQGVEVDRPAVISVNMLFGSLAVNEFLARIHRFRNVGNEEYTTVRGDLCEFVLFRESRSDSAGHLVREIGLGNQRPPLGRASLSE